jgi:hypothetical protein
VARAEREIAHATERAAAADAERKQVIADVKKDIEKARQYGHDDNNKLYDSRRVVLVIHGRRWNRSLPSADGNVVMLKHYPYAICHRLPFHRRISSYDHVDAINMIAARVRLCRCCFAPRFDSSSSRRSLRPPRGGRRPPRAHPEGRSETHSEEVREADAVRCIHADIRCACARHYRWMCCLALVDSDRRAPRRDSPQATSAIKYASNINHHTRVQGCNQDERV